MVKLKLVVAGAGALLLVGLGIGASAYASGAAVPFLAAAKPTPSPGSARQAACNGFISHLAANLGVSQSKLRSALQKSAGQTIDDAVAAGRLTQQQAARIKQRIDSGTVCSFGGLGQGRRFGRPAGLVMEAVVKAAAETLNLTPQQLAADVRQGQTLSSLAHGMTEDQFRKALLGHLKTDLDALVKQGKLSSAMESALLQRMQTAPIPFWEKAGKFGGHAFLPPVAPGASPATGA